MDYQRFLHLLASNLTAAEKEIKADRAWLETRSPGMKETALHHFTIEGDLNVVRLLLRNHADVNATNSAQQTALMNAAQLNNSEMVQLLFEHGADHTLKDENGDTALHVAVEGGCMKAAGALIAAGSDINQRNGLGDDLRTIVPYKKLAALELLLQGLTG